MLIKSFLLGSMVMGLIELFGREAKLLPKEAIVIRTSSSKCSSLDIDTSKNDSCANTDIESSLSVPLKRSLPDGATIQEDSFCSRGESLIEKKTTSFEQPKLLAPYQVQSYIGSDESKA